MEFKVIEQRTADYNALKQDYINGFRYPHFHSQYGVGRSQYRTLLQRFADDGVEVKLRRTPIYEKPHYNPKHISRRLVKGIAYWTVTKWINGELHYFGNYKSKAKAEQRVKELKQNNWNGLMNFRVIEGVEDSFDYEEIKKDYLNPELSVKSIKEKYNISNSKWDNRIIKRFKEENIPLRCRSGLGNNSKNYCKSKNRFMVYKTVNRVKYHFGYYKTEDEAKARVEELKMNGWDGLL